MLNKDYVNKDGSVDQKNFESVNAIVYDPEARNRDAVPCPRHGCDHTVSRQKTSPVQLRYVRGITSSDDFALGSIEHRCHACRDAPARSQLLQRKKDLVSEVQRTANASTVASEEEGKTARTELKEVKRQLADDHTCCFTSSNPDAVKHLLLKRPGPAMELPCHLTHRGAVTRGLCLWITSSLRTADGPGTTERMMNGIRNADRLRSVTENYAFQRASPICGEGDESFVTHHPAWFPATVSDTWIRTIQDAFVNSTRSHLLRCMCQKTATWCKQALALDHSMKRFSRQGVQRMGAKVGTAIFSVMNSIGQIVLCRGANATSCNDASTVEGLNSLGEMLESLGIDPQLVHVDNPKDFTVVHQSVRRGGSKPTLHAP